MFDVVKYGRSGYRETLHSVSTLPCAKLLALRLSQLDAIHEYVVRVGNPSDEYDLLAVYQDGTQIEGI